MKAPKTYKNKFNVLLVLGAIWLGIPAIAFGQSAMPQDDPRFNQLGNKFTQDKLSERDREAFELRAVEKLQDFADYLALAGSGSFHADMRAEAGRMAVGLFREEDEVFVLLEGKPRNPDRPTQFGPVSKFVRQLQKDNRFNAVKTELEEVRLSEEARADKSGGYRGKLAFRLNITYFAGEEPVSGESYSGEINFWLLRQEKQFGNEKKLVWETKLGGIVGQD